MFFAATLAAFAVFVLVEPASAAGAGAGGDVCAGDACSRNVVKLANGLAMYALLTAVAGIMVSAILWAVGSKGQNPGTELAGKKGMIVCCTAAFLVGALPAWIDFLNGAAKDIDSGAGGAGIRQ